MLILILILILGRCDSDTRLPLFGDRRHRRRPWDPSTAGTETSSIDNYLLGLHLSSRCRVESVDDAVAKKHCATASMGHNISSMARA